jgi:predicted DNA-binding WGR domain protein
MSRFWEVSQNGSWVTIRFGRIGNEGQTPKTKNLGSFKKAAAYIQKLIREKTGKGYVAVSGSDAEISGARPENIGFLTLVEARNSGVAFLRTVWEGYNDDGFFTHTLFDENRCEIGVFSSYETNKDEFETRLGEEVLRLLEENEFSWHPVSVGSVGVLELDLRSGNGTWREADGYPAARLAEFLLECERDQVVALRAKVEVQFVFENGESDNQHASLTTAYLGDLEISSFETDPPNVATNCNAGNLEGILRRLDLDYPEPIIEGVAEKLGEKVPSSRNDCSQRMFSLSVDVAKRTFVFTGKGKKASYKVPRNVLKTTRFHVDLAGPQDGGSKTAQRSKK